MGDWGRSFVSIALLLFGFSTILYNYYLGENSLTFFSTRNQNLFNGFRVLIIGLVCWGSTTDLGTVFGFADVTMGLLALANLVALVFLIKPGLRILRDFDEQIASGVEQPVFNADNFRDLHVDRGAWEIEPEDLERIQAAKGTAPARQ